MRRAAHDAKLGHEEVPYPSDVVRPKTRADCAGGPRPCPFVSCRHHLFLDVKPNGSIQWNFGEEPAVLDELLHSCALDVADRDGSTREYLSRVLHVNRERVRQIEQAGLAKIAELFD